jgi:acetyl esterase
MPDEARSSDPIARLDPQIVEALKKSEELAKPYGAPPVNDPIAMRAYHDDTSAWWNEGGPTLAVERGDTIPGPFRDIPVRVYCNTQGGGLPVFVWFHGGGFRVGSEHSNARQMREIAAAWPGIVVGSDYVHMPEHVFPDQLTEALTVFGWLADHGAEWGIDGSRIAFGGASAGANLGVAAALEFAKTRPGVLKAGVGVVGAYDAELDSESVRDYGDGRFFILRDNIPNLFKAYAADASAKRDPRVFVTEGDVSVLPPIMLCAAECDPFADSSRRLATKLEAAGKLHALNVYPGMMHLYFGFTRTVDRARECVEDVVALLEKI